MAQAVRTSDLPSEDVLNVVMNYILRTRTEDSSIGGLSFIIFHAILLKGEERKKLSILSIDDLNFAKTTYVASERSERAVRTPAGAPWNPSNTPT